MILATPGGDVERRDVSLGSLLTLNGIPLRGDSSVASASPTEVAGIPAWQQAVRIASQAMMRHELAVWRGQAPTRTQVTATWQARFFADQPNPDEPWSYVWECTEASLTARNNGYWRKLHDAKTGRVAAVRVLHPDNVLTSWNPVAQRAEYSIRLDSGQWSVPLTSYDVLHFRVGHPNPGGVLAPSPIELHRRTLGADLARTRAEAQTYAQGQRKAVAVVFPESITPEQSERWRQVYLEDGGNSESPVKVFGGGATIQEIGLSMDDMQFIETQQFSIEDVGRILGVMPSLLWAASRYGDKPLTPEHEEDRWFRHGLEPRRTRIEDTIKADPDFFGAGARDYPSFKPPAIRADRDTEVSAYVKLVQTGIIVPDTAAEALGFPPLPDGLGQIVQVTPVGGAPNEPAQPQAPAVDEERLARRVVELGAESLRGERGEPGPAGRVGERGPEGERGGQGEPGAAGKDGESGRDGERGPKGDKGDRGERGERGEAGAPAAPTSRTVEFSDGRKATIRDAD